VIREHNDRELKLSPPPGFRGVFRTDEDARAVYSEAAGISRIMPGAVSVPVDADDVVAIVKWAAAGGMSLVPRGSGSSMAGGAVGPGVIVDVSRIDWIGEPDLPGKRIWVGPGATRARVSAAVEKLSLRFPVDPSSGSFCTIGGMVSTNAAGSHSLRFGATREWVRSLDCVFDDGTRAILTRGIGDPTDVPAIQRFSERVRARIVEAAESDIESHPDVLKDSSGYGIVPFRWSGDLVDVLVGSEGTLAIIVGIELDLVETAGATSGVMAAFASLDDAVRAATLARESGAAACELLDRTFLEISALSNLPPWTEAVLLAEVEADSAADAAIAARELGTTFEKAGATGVSVAVTTVEQKEIWELRHAASPVLARLDPSLRSMQFIEDGAVPPDRLADYVRGVREALDEWKFRGVIFGHAGDAHIHVNPLIDVSRPDWRHSVLGLLGDVASLTAALNGTLSGEHGDGRIRAALLPFTWPTEAINLFSAIKRCFDPKEIFNPGVKVPLGEVVLADDNKYDPDAPPIPPRARGVLDKISDERLYAASRLSLLDGAG
jgi:FAD/FMN-containing dehydrogenase